jgi:hypothetical protein
MNRTPYPNGVEVCFQRESLRQIWLGLGLSRGREWIHRIRRLHPHFVPSHHSDVGQPGHRSAAGGAFDFVNAGTAETIDLMQPLVKNAEIPHKG